MNICISSYFVDDAAGQRDQIKKLEDKVAGYVRDNAELKAVSNFKYSFD